MVIEPLPNGDRALSKSHNYYYQVQGQLTTCILNLPFCNFMCWTPNRMQVERIEQDDIFCEAMLNTLETFFVEVVLPHVLTGQLQGPSKSQPKLHHNKLTQFCYCHREEVDK